MEKFELITTPPDKPEMHTKTEYELEEVQDYLFRSFEYAVFRGLDEFTQFGLSKKPVLDDLDFVRQDEDDGRIYKVERYKRSGYTKYHLNLEGGRVVIMNSNNKGISVYLYTYKRRGKNKPKIIEKSQIITDVDQLMQLAAAVLELKCNNEELM